MVIYNTCAFDEGAVSFLYCIANDRIQIQCDNRYIDNMLAKFDRSIGIVAHATLDLTIMDFALSSLQNKHDICCDAIAMHWN